MLAFDELLLMSEKEKLDYLRKEEEAIISTARGSSVLELRKIQSKCDRIRKTVKTQPESSSIICHEAIEHPLELDVEDCKRCIIKAFLVLFMLYAFSMLPNASGDEAKIPTVKDVDESAINIASSFIIKQKLETGDV